MEDYLVWIGIAFCLSQSAIFSGTNLAFFSLTRLRLEIEAEFFPKSGAKKVLDLRYDSNFLLTTILWGNVGINVLLTLLSDSVMTGVISFAFSTFVITLFGEILPQAYFSRHAVKMASLLSPVLKFYQILLYPVAKPSALLLDYWLGKESVQFFAEKYIKNLIKKHIDGADNEIDKVEGIGAINFLSLDDISTLLEGENIDSDSIISLETRNKRIVFPEYSNNANDKFIQKINKSGKKWIIFTNEENVPRLALDADGFIRSALVYGDRRSIRKFCHIPLIVRDETSNLGEIITSLKYKSNQDTDDPIKKDIVLFWNNETKRIITGADLFGRLLKGI